MISDSTCTYRLRKEQTHWTIEFAAMASPCEIMIRSEQRSEVERLASLSLAETRRIEQTYSRYRNDNIIHAINNSNGQAVKVDEELARLLDYADQCYHLSEGLFDITSGVLRGAWRFDGDEFTPDEQLIATLRQRVGWEKVEWNNHSLRLQPGMEIDLGGIGKEYAVDVVAELLFRESNATLMVNFGGDIRAIASASDPEPWVVGIEDPDLTNAAIGEVKLINGGVATSGDLRRYCLVNGARLGHILNPHTGWPVAEAPRSITVLGNYCVEAGFLATLAFLRGAGAEAFLKSHDAQGHCFR